MAIYFRRITLSAPTSANLLTFPMTLGESSIAIFVAVRRIIEQFLLGADYEAIDHRLHARHSARDTRFGGA